MPHIYIHGLNYFMLLLSKFIEKSFDRVEFAIFTNIELIASEMIHDYGSDAVTFFDRYFIHC